MIVKMFAIAAALITELTLVKMAVKYAPAIGTGSKVAAIIIKAIAMTK